VVEVVVTLHLNWAIVFGRLFGHHVNRDVVSKVCDDRLSERYESFKIGLRKKFTVIG